MMEVRLDWKHVLALAFGGWISVAGASTWYVSSSSGNDSADGKSWNTALASIQRAIDVASSNDLINVRKGVYEKIVTSNKALRIMACDNRDDVVIDGKGRFRCAYLGENLAQTNTQIHGFTIRYGYVNRNYGAGVRGGTIVNCEIHGCTNTFYYLNTEGGGTYGTFAIRSFIHHNRATHGGAICKGVAERCVLAENEVDDDGGAALDSALVGCLVVGNRAYDWGGKTTGAAMQRCTATNCTVVGNFARSGGVIANSKLYNCIVYSNSFTSGTEIMDAAGSSSESKTALVSCSTNNPFFSDAEHGDYTLSAESPCLDAGNNAYVTQDVDLNGNPRIFNGTVDIGAYEFVHGHVANVIAQQRYPWNGLVDVDFDLLCELADVQIPLTLIVHDNAGGTNLPCHTVWVDGVAAEKIRVKSGHHRVTWDAAADLPDGFACDRVAVEVKTIAPELGGIQLWENGPYWAECNVGATKPEEYGYYFWWGDTVGYTRSGGTWTNDYYYSGVTWVSSTGTRMSNSPFSSSSCTTCNKNTSTLQAQGYIDSTGNLVAKYDAATAHLGAPWRMPTDAEFSALFNICTTTWTTRNGVYGWLVTGKGAYASKSIFFPAAGCCGGSNLSDPGSIGYYWSSTPSTPFGAYSDFAQSLLFNSGGLYPVGGGRTNGQSVRPLRGFAR